MIAIQVMKTGSTKQVMSTHNVAEATIAYNKVTRNSTVVATLMACVAPMTMFLRNSKSYYNLMKSAVTRSRDLLVHDATHAFSCSCHGPYGPLATRAPFGTTPVRDSREVVFCDARKAYATGLIGNPLKKKTLVRCRAA